MPTPTPTPTPIPFKLLARLAAEGYKPTRVEASSISFPFTTPAQLAADLANFDEITVFFPSQATPHLQWVVLTTDPIDPIADFSASDELFGRAVDLFITEELT